MQEKSMKTGTATETTRKEYLDRWLHPLVNPPTIGIVNKKPEVKTNKE